MPGLDGGYLDNAGDFPTVKARPPGQSYTSLPNSMRGQANRNSMTPNMDALGALHPASIAQLGGDQNWNGGNMTPISQMPNPTITPYQQGLSNQAMTGASDYIGSALDFAQNMSTNVAAHMGTAFNTNLEKQLTIAESNNENRVEGGRIQRDEDIAREEYKQERQGEQDDFDQEIRDARAMGFALDQSTARAALSDSAADRKSAAKKLGISMEAFDDMSKKLRRQRKMKDRKNENYMAANGTFMSAGRRNTAGDIRSEMREGLRDVDRQRETTTIDYQDRLRGISANERRARNDLTGSQIAQKVFGIEDTQKQHLAETMSTQYGWNIEDINNMFDQNFGSMSPEDASGFFTLMSQIIETDPTFEVNADVEAQMKELGLGVYSNAAKPKPEKYITKSLDSY